MHELRPHRRRDSRERPELVGKVGELIHEVTLTRPLLGLVVRSLPISPITARGTVRLLDGSQIGGHTLRTLRKS
jgi:hypothetical protein